MYVIYEKETTFYMRDMKRGGYKSKGAATAALNKAAKKKGSRFNPAIEKSDYAIADSYTFATEIEKMVTRINLMSNKPFEERANTPIYCSPAFESYWSM